MISGVKEKPALWCVASVLEAVGGPHSPVLEAVESPIGVF